MHSSELEKQIIDELLRIRRGEPIHSSSYGSRTFESGQLGQQLKHYFEDTLRLSKSEAALTLKMSAGSFKRITETDRISSEMLSRVFEYFEKRVDDQIAVLEELEIASNTDWRLTDASRVQRSIARVSIALFHLLKAVQSSNSVGSTGSAINTIQKAQLIAMLEATLAALKAPAVKRSQTSGLISWLRSILKRGAEKGLEKSVSESLGEAIAAGEELILQLGDQPAISDLDKLL